MQSTDQWLSEIGLGQYASIFAENDVSLDLLPTLTDEDLKELGLSLGHRRRLQQAIAERTSEHGVSEPVAARSTEEGPRLGTAPEAERRQLTVMFSDLVSSTALSERFDPEDLSDIIRAYQDCCASVITRFEGYVAKYMGDGILVYFGYPQAHDDDAERALRAGLEMVEAVRDLQVHDDLSLQVRIGVATGLVVVGESIGSGTSQEQTVVGETPNLAARLQSLAQPNSVVVAPSTRQLAGEVFDYADLGSHLLKGFSDPVQASEVVGVGASESRFEATRVRRGLTPYAGREEEVRILHDSLSEARGGHGRFVTTVGEPGVGKSRLLYEFRNGIDRDEVLVLQGRCQSYGENISYLPFVDCLLRALQLRDEDSVEHSVEKAVSNILAIDPMLEPYLPYYLQLLSMPHDKYPLPQRFQGDDKRHAFEESLAAIFTMASRHQPIVLMLEDWHWADEASDSALKYLIGAITDHPILVVANYRPEYEERWGHLSHHTSLTLKPLEVDTTESMIRSSLKATVLPEGLSSLIYARTSGNPLFVEEICSALVEDGSVQVTGPDAVLTRPVEEISLPDTIQAVIRSRLDKVDPDFQETLRLASVIGREFSKRVLEAVHTEASQLDRSLSGLISQDLIQQLRVVPEVEYMFKHVLTQLVVYETLLLRRRRQLHALVGRAMETLYADRLPQFYEALAHHFDAGEVWSEAVYYRVQAGMKAMQHHVISAALTHFDRANEILRGQQIEIPWRVRYDLSFQRSIALGDRGRWNAAYDEMAQAEAIARDKGATALQVQSMFALSNAAFWAHLFDESLRIATELERIVGDNRDTQLGVGSLQAMSTFMLGDLGSALKKEGEITDLFRQVPESPHVSRAAFIIGVFHRFRGDNKAAAEFLDLASQRAKQEASAGGYIQSYMHYCLAIGELGRYQEAIERLHEARDYGVRADSVYGVLKIDNTLGWAYLEICNFDTAIRHNESCLMTADEVRGVTTSTLSEVDSFGRLNLGDVYAMLGDLSRAREYYEQAYENAKDNQYFLARTRWKPRCLIALGELWLAL
ncbi:MAG: AAA family ATPase, partial [Chloroflexi bacterium]|nr:AAA family ATPase [Chloroflexota bacterium]